MRLRGMEADWSAESLALYTQATIQGAFVLAKAQHNAKIAGECIDHLRRYLELLFNQPNSQNGFGLARQISLQNESELRGCE